jgi:hypothetical protein
LASGGTSTGEPTPFDIGVTLKTITRERNTEEAGRSTKIQAGDCDAEPTVLEARETARDGERAVTPVSPRTA